METKFAVDTKGLTTKSGPTSRDLVTSAERRHTHILSASHRQKNSPSSEESSPGGSHRANTCSLSLSRPARGLYLGKTVPGACPSTGDRVAAGGLYHNKPLRRKDCTWSWKQPHANRCAGTVPGNFERCASRTRELHFYRYSPRAACHVFKLIL